ncbi:MAG: type II toxin-antitoxin system RelE/ParE family toxin [Bacteroidetes bacterium]|nr:type II toxin-antitoxin system RelE/ParE family toxin [Bacteroidota bacterium]
MREITFYTDDFIRFYESLDLKTQRKIDFILNIIRFEKQVPKKFFKHLKGTNGIYEIRIMVAQGSIRILSFFDKGNLIILINCFNKKTRKIPAKEIKRAIKLRHEYFED